MDDRRLQKVNFYLSHKKQILAHLLPQEEHPVMRIKTEKKVVALTCDCCCYCEVKKLFSRVAFFFFHKIPCTFFVSGVFAISWKRQYFIKILHLLGFEIMNHSVSHPNFLKISPEQQRHEILDNGETLEKITGVYPKLFRFPFGNFGLNAMGLLKKSGITPIQWDVDTMDWEKDCTDEKTYHAIMDSVVSGSIILSHIFGKGFGGIKQAVMDLKKQGYRFVTVTQLLAMEDKSK